MTVINPNSISGITSITLPSGGDNVLTIHTNDGTERFRIDSSGNVKVGSACTISQDGDVFFTGVCTATTLSGAASGLTGSLPAISGANLTNLTAGNLTGALPAISGANLTGIAATDNVRTGILDVAGIATFRSDVNIPNINGGQIGGRRNIIINGAMQIAQRATTYTGANAFGTVDRFRLNHTGLNEDCTTAQADVASGTTPYTLGFRKAFKITNGNHTAGAGAGDRIAIQYRIEAQDVANSGWNYVSSSSNITLQFWVKSSVAQNFYGRLYTSDGTSQNYPFETGSLSADTWTKITKTISGNSNLTFDNDNGRGLDVEFTLFRGTNETGSVTLNQWAAFNSGTYTPDNTSTWYTTNDATFEITGLQLEVGSQATAFEHRSFGEELQLCKRYYEVLVSGSGKAWGGAAVMYTGNETHHQCNWVEKRATPSLEYVTGSDYYRFYGNGTNVQSSRPTSLLYAHTKAGGVQTTSAYLSGSLLQGGAAFAYSENASAYIAVDAEL